MDLNNIIIRPIITEKSMDDVALGKFTFEINKDADKNSIKQAIEQQFQVNVISVTTQIIKGKRGRFGVRRIEKIKSPWKKATVELKSGQKIDLFDTGTQK